MLQPTELLTSVALHMEEASVKKTFLTGEFSERSCELVYCD